MGHNLITAPPPPPPMLFFSHSPSVPYQSQENKAMSRDQSKKESRLYLKLHVCHSMVGVEATKFLLFSNLLCGADGFGSRNATSDDKVVVWIK